MNRAQRIRMLNEGIDALDTKIAETEREISLLEESAEAYRERRTAYYERLQKVEAMME